VGLVRPSAPLAAWVDHYWFSVQASAPVTVVLPDGRVDLVLESSATRASAAVYGSVTAATAVALAPGARYTGVQFRAGAARHFLDAAACELTDRAVEAERVLRVDLTGALDADDPRTAIARLDAALCHHVARMPPAAARIDQLVATLEAAQGLARIDALAARFGVSRRQIERDFRDAVGLAPKTLAAILRFRHAAERLRAGDPLASAALAAGYADQAHLSRDCRRWAGLTPGAYTRGDVAFLQDGKQPADDDEGFIIRRSSS
jgi:AraC-like DNA-binding protein